MISELVGQEVPPSPPLSVSEHQVQWVVAQTHCEYSNKKKSKGTLYR